MRSRVYQLISGGTGNCDVCSYLPRKNSYSGPRYNRMGWSTAGSVKLVSMAQATSVSEQAVVEQVKAPSRLLYIEGMRGIAASYVAVQHICTMIDPYRGLQRPDASPAWLAWITTPLWYGHLAVAAFIVISGFCLQLALYGRGGGQLLDVRAFFVRRCRRILPPYYACLALSLVVVYFVTRHQQGLPWSQYLPVTTTNVLAHVLMIHNFSPEWMYKINGVLWSISIEFQLYFLFPILVALLWKRGPYVMLGLCCIFSGAMLLLFPVAEKLYVWYLPLFALGMAGAKLVFDPRAPRPNVQHVGFIAAIFLVLGAWAVSWTKSIVPADCLMGVGTAALLMYGKLALNSPITRLLASKPLSGVGKFSYSLYLVHHPLLQIMFVTRPAIVSTPPREFVYLLIVGLPIIFYCCYLFYRAFEKPFISAPRVVQP